MIVLIPDHCLSIYFSFAPDFSFAISVSPHFVLS